MDLTYPPEAEEFRGEIRAWLEENLPEGWFDDDVEMTPEEREKFNEEWPSKLFEGGWICATWPEEYGGKGLTLMQGVVLAEEFARAKAPMRADFFGDTLVGPTILQWGTEEQKQEFLPKIMNGQMRWCQGFSEPDSGSGLASLKTTAVLDGDEWVINGQKVWTTQAQFADYCFVLARTDPNVKKQAGISYLLVPMDQPGVEVRGITQPDGTAEFNEVFFADARCPEANVVGGVNNGWAVANTTLGFERGQSATTGYRRFEEEWRLMVAEAERNGAISDPTIRQRLALYYSKIQIIRINGLRSLSSAVTGKKDPSVGALGATNKMFWSEMHKEAMELALDIYGPASMLVDTNPPHGSWPATMRGDRRETYPVSAMMSAFFFSRSETIWGGTSQIQRNIVGEKVLGLPREPKAPAEQKK
jgi:alkylation response protein AidB-like acyl-CoA dehydrogenase